MQNQKTDQHFVLQRGFFKYSTLIILFILLLAQLTGMVLKVRIIPEVISLCVAFICVLYLWLSEKKDIEVLQRTNADLLQAREDLEISHVETILSLVLSQEAKDSYTYGHSERVRRYAMVLAQKLGLPKEEVETIGRGAKLHDIGKIGIKDEILFGTGKLTDEQFKIIKSHPGKGVAILEPLKFLNQEKLIVRHHHEHYDGTGYPDGLKGEHIPLGARIVGVADALDAMKSDRHYRKSLSKEEIVMQFASNAGTQFDPKVVKILLATIDSFFV